MKFFNQIDLKFGTDPYAKLEGDVLVCVGAAIASGFCLQADGIGFVDSFFDADFVAV